MSIYENLKNDHQKVSGLFVKIQQTKNEDISERERLFEELKSEYFAHSEAEEKVFYNELLKFPETEYLIPQSIEEHEKVDQIIKSLDSMDKSDPEWMHVFSKLKANIEEHVEKEEMQVFSHSRMVIGRHKADEMGISFKIFKDKFLNVKI